MSDTISPNMGLVVPGVGTEPGPTWATDLNASLTIIDAHNHAPGAGVQIPPAGLNINTDLPFNGNNQTAIRSSRYTAQGAPLAGSLDLGCVYVSGVDLYYNDENGNQIQITKNGSVAGTSGSIANLTSPASASYVSGSGTFVWQSDANTAASMDNGSVTIRKLTPSSPGITLAAPVALSSNYTLTLPSSPPSTTSVLVMDNSGNVSASNPSDLVITGNLTVGGEIDATSYGNIDVPTGDITVDLGDITAGTGSVIAQEILPGGPSGAGLTAANPDSLLAVTSTGSFPVAITSAFATARSVAGTVERTTANILAGGGFSASTSTVSGTTTLAIVFTVPFSGIPVIVVSDNISGSVALIGPAVTAATISSLGFQVQILAQANLQSVSFIAMGPV